MNKEFLNLRPIKYLCPYCGEWHDWTSNHTLGGGKHHFICPNLPLLGFAGKYSIYFSNDFCHFATYSICNVATQFINDTVRISSIIESATEPVVTFQVHFLTYLYPGPKYCTDCNFKKDCICLKSCNEIYNHHMTITLGFEFYWRDYKKIHEETDNSGEVKAEAESNAETE